MYDCKRVLFSWFALLNLALLPLWAGAQAPGDIQVLLDNGSAIAADGTSISVDAIPNAIKTLPFNGGFIVATAYGELFGVGVDVPFDGAPVSRPVMVDFFALPGTTGGYFADRFGGVHPVGNAPFFGASFFGSPFSPLPIARDFEPAMDASGNVIGYYTLGRDGSITAQGQVPKIPGVRVNDAEALKVSPTGDNYAVITSRGDLHTFGNAPVVDVEIDLGPNVRAIDFSYTVTGGGFYVLDNTGIIHSFGDAAVIANQTPVEGAKPVGLLTNVPTGSITNLPDDIVAVPTATATNTPTAFPPTNTPTAVAPTNTPVAPTNTPLAPTNTPVTTVPTNTPTVAVVPTDTPPPVSGETPTATPTATSLPPTATPTVTNTPAAESPTPTPEAGSDLVSPGIRQGMLGLWVGTSEQTGKTYRIDISVENDKVIVTDVGRNLFSSGSRFEATAFTGGHVTVNSTQPGVIIEILQATGSLVDTMPITELVAQFSTTTFTFPPQSNSFVINFNRG